MLRNIRRIVIGVYFEFRFNALRRRQCRELQRLYPHAMKNYVIENGAIRCGSGGTVNADCCDSAECALVRDITSEIMTVEMGIGFNTTDSLSFSNRLLAIHEVLWFVMKSKPTSHALNGHSYTEVLKNIARGVGSDVVLKKFLVKLKSVKVLTSIETELPGHLRLPPSGIYGSPWAYFYAINTRLDNALMELGLENKGEEHVPDTTV